MDPEKVNYHYCDDLQTEPLPQGTRVLVTGSRGYIGHRLIPELLYRGYTVRCMLRDNLHPLLLDHPNLEIVYADVLKKKQLWVALKDVKAAYYLIHSMRETKEIFMELDRKAAKNFFEVAEACNLEKIIYLGGLGEATENISDHLRSRQEVGLTLANAKATVIRLRAGIIIGTGSASYELLKSLVINNRWIPFLQKFNSRCQPIAIRDVIKYLVGVLETPGLNSKMYPIGGADVLSYKELIQEFAKEVKRKVRFIDVSWVPFPVPWMCRLYAYWMNFFVSVPVNIISLLLNSLKTDVICSNQDIKTILPFETVGYRTAIKWAQEKEKRSQVYSHWGGVAPETMSDLLPISEYEASEFLVDQHSIDIPTAPENIFKTVRRVGGDHGWVHANILWEIRGVIDRMLGGVGLNRGRRDPENLRVGDAIDFWRVEKLDENKELLLRAELLSPGLSWLQFILEPIRTGHTRLILKAHFIPFPLWGKIYWMSLSKFHDYIFKGMLKYFYLESMKLENSNKPLEGEKYETR